MKTNKDSKTSNNSRAKIEVYKCDIYGCDLVVANQYTTLEQLKEKYTFFDDTELSDVCFCSPEPFCYLQGWACECIYKTLKK